MNRGRANLRISYLGGGYDFPQFFEKEPVHIIAEALSVSVECVISNAGISKDGLERKIIEYNLPKNLGSGLASSAARHLSFLRAKFPDASWREHIDAGIALNGLQAGGWQDTIAAAYHGFIRIVLHQGQWNVYPIADMNLAIHPYRQLYRIPVVTTPKKILTSMQCQESSFTPNL